MEASGIWKRRGLKVQGEQASGRDGADDVGEDPQTGVTWMNDIDMCGQACSTYLCSRRNANEGAKEKKEEQKERRWERKRDAGQTGGKAVR